MNIKALDADDMTGTDAEVLLLGDDFEEESPRSLVKDTDSRRRLEDKLEEMRLKREMREYDFDI